MWLSTKYGVGSFGKVFRKSMRVKQTALYVRARSTHTHTPYSDCFVGLCQSIYTVAYKMMA